MNNTPQWLKERWSNEHEPVCARKGSDCSGRNTKEHALIYQGRQVQDYFAVIDLCWYHHLGKGLNKEYNRYLALMRATDEDLDKYPKSDFKQMKKYLIEKYGKTTNL